MKLYKNPSWWNVEHDTAWRRVRQSMKRACDQTNHGLGAKWPVANPYAGDSSRRAGGGETVVQNGQPSYKELEPAYRFGFAARAQFGEKYPEWDDDLEQRLAEEWRALAPERREKWPMDREAIRYGWDFQFDEEDDDDEELD